MDRDQIWIKPDTTIEFSSNHFRNVETILRIDNDPVIYLTDAVGLDRSLAFDLFGDDGDRIAVTKGVRIFPAAADMKRAVRVRKEPGLWTCEVDGRPCYEVRFTGPAAVSIDAELYSPSGRLLRICAKASSFFECKPSALIVGPALIQECEFANCSVGVHLMTSASIVPVAGTALPFYL